jgi:hypothetical protein
MASILVDNIFCFATYILNCGGGGGCGEYLCILW